MRHVKNEMWCTALAHAPKFAPLAPGASVKNGPELHVFEPLYSNKPAWMPDANANQGWQTWFLKFLVFYGFLEKPGFLH
jgi:hypothetical protein